MAEEAKPSHATSEFARSKLEPHPETRSVPQRGVRAQISETPGWMRPDWVVVILPTALSIKAQYSAVSESAKLLIIAAFVLINLLLVFIAFTRRTGTTFDTQLGPLALLVAASGIVVTRPDGIQNLITFLLVGALAFRLSQTVDARKIIASLIDGIGLYCLANVLAYVAGLRSSSEAMLMNLTAEAMARTYFPLSQSINLTPALAACYLTSVYFVFREPGWLRRGFRLLFAVAASIIIFESGTRAALLIGLLLLATAVLLPRAMRLLAPTLVPFAFLSPLVLRPLIASFSYFISGIISLISNRSVSDDKVVRLAGRGFIWDQSMDFWQSSVNAPFNILFGYGLRGHYKSGASHTYAGFMSGTYRDTERAMHMHNSSLQQLFDAGIVGWILLAIALFWASLRLAKRASEWGNYALAGSVIMSCLLLGSLTEVLLTPDLNLYTFFVMIILVAAACQRCPVDEETRVR